MKKMFFLLTCVLLLNLNNHGAELMPPPVVSQQKNPLFTDYVKDWKDSMNAYCWYKWNKLCDVTGCEKVEIPKKSNNQKKYHLLRMRKTML